MMAFFLTMPTSITMPIIAITDSSMLNSIRVRIAPMPAEGSPEMMVIGWMKLSYKMPRITNAANTAARISTPCPRKLSWNTWAVPEKPVAIVTGSRAACSIVVI